MCAFTRKAKTFLLSGDNYENGLSKSDILAINRDLEHSFLNFQTIDNPNTTPFLLIDQSSGAQTISGGTPIFNTLKAGTPPNFTSFEADGTMVMNGTATTFIDQLNDALTLKATGNKITVDDAESCQVFATNATLTDYLHANYQLNHNRKLGTVIFPHIHFFQTENNVPNFLIQYRWQKNGGTKVTGWTSLKCNSTAFSYTSGSLNQIATTSSGITPPAGDNISDIVQMRVIRDNANTSTLFSGTDPFTTSVSVIAIDIHIELDTLGSRTEYSK